MVTPKVPLWAHQKEAVERATPLSRFAFFFDVGTGKTATAINVLRNIYARHGRMRTLIFAPPVVLENWRREIDIHSYIPDFLVKVLAGPWQKRLKIFDGTNRHYKDEAIYITNYELLLNSLLFMRIYEWQPQVIIFDESHKLKEPSSKRSKLCWKLARGARYKYLLTGTPFLNSPMDIFSQYRILDESVFGKAFYTFRRSYFDDANQYMPSTVKFPNWVPKPDAVERIRKKIAPTSMMVKKSECLDLPPLVKKVVEVPLSPEQARHYKEMKRDFVTFIENRVSRAELAVTKALRLMQIASGFIAVEDDKGVTENITIKKNPRAEALHELLETITPEHKCLVWTVHRQGYAVIRNICKQLQIRYVEIHGDTSTKGKVQAVDDLNNDPAVRVLIGHPASGGIGINLIQASYSIFYSRNFSLENDIQAEARNYRGGSEVHEKITRIDIVAKDTIDEVITKKLLAKQAISDEILLDLGKEL